MRSNHVANAELLNSTKKSFRIVSETMSMQWAQEVEDATREGGGGYVAVALGYCPPLTHPHPSSSHDLTSYYCAMQSDWSPLRQTYNPPPSFPQN